MVSLDYYKLHHSGIRVKKDRDMSHEPDKENPQDVVVVSITIGILSIRQVLFLFLVFLNHTPQHQSQNDVFLDTQAFLLILM